MFLEGDKKMQGRNTSLIRQWQILLKINNSLNGVSKGELADYHNVSKRTISRDISALSSSGFPIYEDYKKDQMGQIFYKMVENYKFPTINFDIEELLELFNLYYSIASINPFFKNTFNRFFKKISLSIGYEMNIFFKDASKIFIPDNSFQVIHNEELEELVFELFEAIRDNQKVCFQYLSMKNGAIKKVTVSPLAIKYFNNNYYLAGYISETDKIYTWALNRISNLSQTSKPRDKVKFDPEDYFNSGFGIYTGDIKIAKVKFKPEIAQFIKERSWHKKQILTDCEDGSVILELPVNSLLEMKKLILSYGKNAIVLEPIELIEIIDEEIKGMQMQYSKLNQNGREEVS